MSRIGGLYEGQRGARSALLFSRGIYFTYFLALGALWPFLNLYFRRLGLSGLQIGLLGSFPALISPLAATFWGGLADRLGIHRHLLTLALVVTMVVGFSYSLTSLFILLCFLALMHAFFDCAIGPIVDSAALEAASDQARSFGQFRVWGTLGWIVSTVIVGRLAESALRRIFYAFAGFTAVAVALSLFQPPRRQLWRRSVREGLWEILSQESTVIFLVSVFVLSIANTAVRQFFSIYMAAIGSKEGLIGLAWAAGAIIEVPMMFFSGAFTGRVGIRRSLIMAFLLYALEWALLSVVSVPEWVVVVQLLDGIAYAIFLTNAVEYMGRIAPAGLGATAQAILSGTTFGLAGFAGALMGGLLYDRVGLARLFLTASGLGLVACLIFILWGIGRTLPAE